HARLRAEIINLTEQLWLNRKKPARGLLREAIFAEHVGTAPIDDETVEAATARWTIAREVRAFLTLFLTDPDWNGFLCLERCLNRRCQRWFFANDDRQQYCSPACRPSRRPGARTERSSRPRARVRSSR